MVLDSANFSDRHHDIDLAGLLEFQTEHEGYEGLTFPGDASGALEQRVLTVSEDVLFKWRLLVEDGRKAGHACSQPDLFIAATALHHGLTIVSRDASEFQQARAAIVNPWEVE